MLQRIRALCEYPPVMLQVLRCGLGEAAPALVASVFCCPRPSLADTGGDETGYRGAMLCSHTCLNPSLEQSGRIPCACRT